MFFYNSKNKFILISVLFLLATSYFLLKEENNTTTYGVGTKVVIIGGTSGIGEALAYEFSKRGYTVGITGRRTHLLDLIKNKIGKNIFSMPMDVINTVEAQKQLSDLITAMGGMDIVVINAGVSNGNLDWTSQKVIIDTNIIGFTSIAAFSTDYFKSRGRGHIVGISSLSSQTGNPHAPTYSASKAYVTNYLEGLSARLKIEKSLIFVTTIEPGLVDTAMLKGFDLPFKDSSTDVATSIVDAVERKDNYTIVTNRWKYIFWLNKFMPEFLKQLIYRIV